MIVDFADRRSFEFEGPLKAYPLVLRSDGSYRHDGGFKMPWVCRVNCGEVSVALGSDPTLRWTLGEGDVFGEVIAPISREASGDLEAGSPISFNSVGDEEPEVMVSAGERDLLEQEENFRQLRSLIRRVGGCIADPVANLARKLQPEIFSEVIEWPEEMGETLEWYEEGSYLVRRGKTPRGFFIVLDNWVRITHDTEEGEQIFALLNTGGLFGETERPLDGQIIPNILSVIAGFAPDLKNSALGLPPYTRVLRIPYEAIDKIIEANPHAKIRDRMEDAFRQKLSSSWALFGLASRATGVPPPLAAVLLREVREVWLKNIPRSWEPLSHDRSDKHENWVPSFHPVGPCKFDIDFRRLVVEAAGGLADSKRRQRYVETLLDLERQQVLTVDFHGESAEDLRHNDMFGEERKITVEVLRPAALERVAQGAKVLNVKYISQEEVTNQWEALAEWWSHHIGDEGDSFRQHFLGPAIRDAIAPATGRRVLDIGCGEGILARQLADSGAEVVAIDPCPNMLHQATRKTRPGAVLYDLRAAVDAADVGKANFDTVVSNMVLMDLPDYQVAIKAIAQALRKGGQAVCSILHPHCFDPETGRWWQDAGHEDPVLFKVRREQGRWARFVRVDANAPVETFYFHRNCDDYRRAFKRVKLKITDELEPEITEGVRDAAGLPPSLPTRPLLIFVVERVG